MKRFRVGNLPRPQVVSSGAQTAILKHHDDSVGVFISPVEGKGVYACRVEDTAVKGSMFPGCLAFLIQDGSGFRAGCGHASNNV